MAKGTMDFAQQNTEQAMQATNWMRAIAEQNLNQSRAAYEGLLTIARNARPTRALRIRVRTQRSERLQFPAFRIL